MTRLTTIAVAIFSICITCPARATLLSVVGPDSTDGIPAAIIPAPPEVLNNAVTNSAQQGFDELQGVLLTAPLDVDGGNIPAGTIVNSHMIFLNQEEGGLLPPALGHEDVVWEFNRNIIGVMSDIEGALEVASSPLLGAIGTEYPSEPFLRRGMEPETPDGYSTDGRRLTVTMHVLQPGDWIRVITIPEPSTVLLSLLGTTCLAWAVRRRH